MDNVGGVDVQAPSQQLVHEVLAMVIGQILSRVYHSVHVCLHQVRDDVDVFVASWSWRLLHVDQPDDIFMVEEFYMDKF